MLVQVSNQIRITKAKETTLEAFREKLTYKNPDFFRAQKLIERGAIGRDELPPKRIYCYEDIDGGIEIPRGTGNLFREVAKETKELLIVKNQVSEGDDIHFELPFRGKFRDWEQYQTRIQDDLEINEYGVYVCPTGGGKTLTALGFVARLQRSAIIIVDRRDLLKQWMDELNEKCDGSFSIGQYGDGKKKWGDVTVAMTQTLKNLKEPEKEKVRNMFGICIVDEVHKASAPTFVDAQKIFASKYIMGISATPKRKDRKEFIFKNYIGPIRLEVSDEEVIEEGRITKVKYKFISTGFSLDYEKINEDITQFPLESLSDYDRNMLILSEVEQEIREGYKPIVFSNRVPHCNNLYRELKARGFKVGLIIGRISGADRDKYKQQMKDDYLDVLVANVSIAGTGLDIPNLSSAHVTFYTSNEVMLKQVAGRIRRAHGEKEFAKLTYYFDEVYKMITNKTNGKKIKIKVDTFENGYKRVRRLFRKWNFEELVDGVASERMFVVDSQLGK